MRLTTLNGKRLLLKSSVGLIADLGSIPRLAANFNFGDNMVEFIFTILGFYIIAGCFISFEIGTKLGDAEFLKLSLKDLIIIVGWLPIFFILFLSKK